MNFVYSARSMQGTGCEGTITAESLIDARRQLRQQGLFVLSLQPGRSGMPAAAAVETRAAAAAGGRIAWRQVSRNDVMLITSQLAIMSRSGVELADAIASLAGTVRQPKLAAALRDVHDALEEGVTLSSALARWPRVFDDVYVASIRAGEASGRMADVLERLAAMLRNDNRLRSAVTGALAYPAVLTGVSSVVLAAIVFFVLPQFARVFSDIGVVPPPTTAVLLSAGKFTRDHAVAIGLGLIAAIPLGVVAARTSACRRRLSAFWLDNPVTRQAARSLATGRLFRLLGAMLQSGIPLLESLQLSARSVASPRFEQLIRSMIDEVTLGHMIGPVLSRADFLPDGAAQMVITAERSGQLSEVFEMTGEYFEQDGERQLRERVRLLEPAVIVVMGLLVGFIVASVMLPLFEFSAASRSG